MLGAAAIASPLFGAVLLLAFSIGRAIPIALGAWAAGWLENISVKQTVDLFKVGVNYKLDLALLRAFGANN